MSWVEWRRDGRSHSDEKLSACVRRLLRALRIVSPAWLCKIASVDCRSRMAAVTGGDSALSQDVEVRKKSAADGASTGIVSGHDGGLALLEMALMAKSALGRMRVMGWRIFGENAPSAHVSQRVV